MKTKTIVERINHRFSSSFGWPEGFVKATETKNGGFILQIGWGDVQFDKEGDHVGGGTDLTNRWIVDIKENVDHCQCDACKGGIIHSSDCSVHNMPAMPNGPCDCGA